MASDNHFGQSSFGDIEEEKKACPHLLPYILTGREAHLSGGSGTLGLVPTPGSQPWPITPSFWMKGGSSVK